MTESKENTPLLRIPANGMWDHPEAFGERPGAVPVQITKRDTRLLATVVKKVGDRTVESLERQGMISETPEFNGVVKNANSEGRISSVLAVARGAADIVLTVIPLK